MSDFLEGIYGYDNYRRFLSDYFKLGQEITHFLSKRYFAKKAGFSSHSFLVHIMKGEKNISGKSVDKIIKGLDLKGREARYFSTLVKFNQARDVEKRQRFYKSLNKLREHSVFYRMISEREGVYFKKWYYPVVREIAGLKGCADPEEIADCVMPKIKAAEAKKAIEDLASSGMIEKEGDGSVRVVNPLLNAETIPPAVFNKVKKEYIFKGVEAMDEMDAETRHLSYVTATLSDQQYKRVVEKLDELRQEVLLLSEDTDSTGTGKKVMQLNLQLYPLSKSIEKRREYNE